MSRVERVQIPKHYQGKQQGSYPRIIRRYSSPHNPTFKSDQLSSAIWENNYTPSYLNKTGSTVVLSKPKQPATSAFSQPPMNPLESLEIATKQFQLKKSLIFGKSPEELAALTNNFSGRRTPRLQLKGVEGLKGGNNDNDEGKVEGYVGKKMVKARSIGRYNDATVFEWQSKPYNIISNFPKDVESLRLGKGGNPEENLRRLF